MGVLLPACHRNEPPFPDYSLERPWQLECEGHSKQEEGAGQKEGSGSLQHGGSKSLAEPHSAHA